MSSPFFIKCLISRINNLLLLLMVVSSAGFISAREGNVQGWISTSVRLWLGKGEKICLVDRIQE